jgi:type IV pilus assembly protein PilB
MNFGTYLAKQNLVTADNITSALAAQKYCKKPIGRLLKDMGVLSEEKTDEALRDYFSAVEVTPLSDVLNMKPRAIALPDEFSHLRANLYRQGRNRVIYTLTSGITDADLRQLEEMTGQQVKPVFVSPEMMAKLSNRDFGVISSSTSDARLRVIQQDSHHTKTSAYTALYHDAIREAHQAKASDIHIKPTADGVDIIFRVLGTMQRPWQRLSLEHRQPFINEAKRLSNLSIAVSGEAQDSRLSCPDLNIDLRVSLTPSHYGEKIVMRRLDRNRSFSMENLAIASSAKSDFIQALRSENGVILISGPTGSGKTTTLYTAVSSLDREKLNVLTVEDPVEYTLPGITQIGINKKLSFASALRAILRQDPDVILLGEIRDEETADLCFKAASTGHLVLSTVHANGAVEVVQRLLGLGVEKYLLKTCLRFSAAQRIARKLCPSCSSCVPIDEISYCNGSDQGANFRTVGQGCEHCRNGYVDLLPILEYLGPKEIACYADSDFTGEIAPRVSLKKAFYDNAVCGLVDVRELDEID